MEQKWFEMIDIRHRKLATAAWIPLRASDTIKEKGKFGFVGYQIEFFGIGTLAVLLENKNETQKLGWADVGISHNHSGYVEKGKYVPSDIFEDYRGKFSALHLVLNQRGNSIEPSEWHLHQDFVVTLGLKREGNSWICPDEDYIEVARITKTPDGSSKLLEVRTSHLKDYLCARGMGLVATSYRDRREVVDSISHISWDKNPQVQIDAIDHWEGHISEIHEGGEPYGSEIAVFHMARTDVDSQEDVPILGPPTDENVTSETWTKKHQGRKLYTIRGELWRTEWVDPASASYIVRGDKRPSSVSFIVDSEGKQEKKEALIQAGRWLWFRPEVIPVLAHRRGGSLSWHTKDTGNIACSPDHGVHFGVNSLGLINVYAKDIALLPEWQQKLWAGYNMIPDGKVSEELLMSQVQANPARTNAPEAFLSKGLTSLDEISKNNLGFSILRYHDQIPYLIDRSHRFRATDKAGLFSLAKDLARLTADYFDAAAIQKVAPPPKGEKRASLKSLQSLLTLRIDGNEAKKIMGPLFGVYELRHADAHLPSRESDEALALVGVDQRNPYVIQGYQLIDACVTSIYNICKVIKNW